MAQPDPGLGTDDSGFLAAFEECRLPESEWTHLAHIRVAWACLMSASAAAALDRVRAGILRYNTEVLDRRDMYHETVTVAFTRLVADRMRPGERWQEFAGRIDDLLDRESPVLLRYYSSGRLFSDEARVRFVEPDKLPLPAFAEPGRTGESDG